MSKPWITTPQSEVLYEKAVIVRDLLHERFGSDCIMDDDELATANRELSRIIREIERQ